MQKVESVSKKLELSIGLSLFFPVLLQALFSLSETEQVQVGETVLTSGAMIFFLLLNYLFFHSQKNTFSDRQLDYMEWAYSSIIGCFSFLVLFFALVANKNIVGMDWVALIFYPIALGGFVYLPVISLILMGIIFTVGCLKE